MSRDLSAHDALCEHLEWLIASIRIQSSQIQSTDPKNPTPEETLKRTSFLYLLASLGATAYEFLWSNYYLHQPNAAVTSVSIPTPNPTASTTASVRTDADVLGHFLKNGKIDVETHRALRQLNDFRNLIKRPYSRIEWNTLSEVEWHLDQVTFLMTSFEAPSASP